jgi:hypothetical protein
MNFAIVLAKNKTEIKTDNIQAHFIHFGRTTNRALPGIKRFYYEPFGNAYNVYFEQFATDLTIKAVVMYNKLDEHDFSSHNSDLLLLSPEQINFNGDIIQSTSCPLLTGNIFGLTKIATTNNLL